MRSPSDDDEFVIFPNTSEASTSQQPPRGQQSPQTRLNSFSAAPWQQPSRARAQTDAFGAPGLRQRRDSRPETNVVSEVHKSFQQSLPSYRGSLTGATGSADPHNSYMRSAMAQIRGFYLIKFAVSVTASYLTIQLLIQFAEVLLPFIFAVLCMIILEPLKRFVMRIMQRLSVIICSQLNLRCCLEGPTDGELPRGVSEVEGPFYGSIPEDSNAEENLRPAVVPIPAVRRMILAVSIAFCLLMIARVLWLTAKVFFRAGYAISANVEFYKQGSNRLKMWVQKYIKDMHIESLDYAKLLDELVEELEQISTVVTTNVLYTALQGVVTFIFLIYMLWSPVKMDGSAVASEVFSSTGRYLKVKCVISACTGISIAIILWGVGLDLPAAFGLLSFLANFLPGIGSFASSVLPCILAIIDVRKTPTQVFVAFVMQMVVHFCIDFVIEPVFFGISVEIHSVIVIIGIYFFYQVWGVPGMLLSVPLLAVVRIMMKSMKHASQVSAAGGEDVDTITFLDNIFAGRWMSTSGESHDHFHELEMADFGTTSQGLRPDLHDPESSRGANSWLSTRTDLWAVIHDSYFGQEVSRIYDNHRLLLDLSFLLLMVNAVIFVPV